MRDQAGFTLLELLVVMIIIALLAAIVVPSFLSQRQKALDADAKSSARTAVLAMETYATDSDGDYDGADVAALEVLEPVLSEASLTVDSASGESYSLTVDSPGGNRFRVERTAGGTWSRTCTSAGIAGCPAGGRWD